MAGVTAEACALRCIEYYIESADACRSFNYLVDAGDAALNSCILLSVTAADDVSFVDAASSTYYEFVSYHQAPVSTACTHISAHNWDIRQVARCKALTADAAACRADTDCTYNTVVLADVLGSEWYEQPGQKLTYTDEVIAKTHEGISEIACVSKCIESTTLCAGVNWSATSEADVTPPTGDCYLLPRKFDAEDATTTIDRDPAYVYYEFVELEQEPTTTSSVCTHKQSWNGIPHIVALCKSYLGAACRRESKCFFDGATTFQEEDNVGVMATGSAWILHPAEHLREDAAHPSFVQAQPVADAAACATLCLESGAPSSTAPEQCRSFSVRPAEAGAGMTCSLSTVALDSTPGNGLADSYLTAAFDPIEGAAYYEWVSKSQPPQPWPLHCTHKAEHNASPWIVARCKAHTE